jgi:DNA-binding GntR family transcriptional regulator
MPIDAFMHEHIEIMDAAASLDFKTAEAALIAHLATSSRKANERLAAYVQAHQVSPIEYVLD